MPNINLAFAFPFLLVLPLLLPCVPCPSSLSLSKLTLAPLSRSFFNTRRPLTTPTPPPKLVLDADALRLVGGAGAGAEKGTGGAEGDVCRTWRTTSGEFTFAGASAVPDVVAAGAVPRRRVKAASLQEVLFLCPCRLYDVGLGTSRLCLGELGADTDAVAGAAMSDF